MYNEDMEDMFMNENFKNAKYQPLMREEMICEQCVLFPREYGYGTMSNDGAGIPTTLSELILSSSGFVKASIPRRL